VKFPPNAISSREDIERIFATASSRLEDALTLAREVAVAGMPPDSAGPAPAAQGAKCFECGASAAHDHHVVPRSLGGTKTVPLCLRCHGNAHGRGRSFRNTPELTKAALGVKRARGERVGCIPWGWRVADDGVRLVPHPGERATTARAKDLRASGLSLAKVAAQLAAEGHATRSGKPFARTEVHVLLKRPTEPEHPAEQAEAPRRAA